MDDELAGLIGAETDGFAPPAAHPALSLLRTADDVGVLDVAYEFGDDGRLEGVVYRLARREFVADPHDRRSWEAVAFWCHVGFRKPVCPPRAPGPPRGGG